MIGTATDCLLPRSLSKGKRGRPKRARIKFLLLFLLLFVFLCVCVCCWSRVFELFHRWMPFALLFSHFFFFFRSNNHSDTTKVGRKRCQQRPTFKVFLFFPQSIVHRRIIRCSPSFSLDDFTDRAPLSLSVGCRRRHRPLNTTGIHLFLFFPSFY